MAIATATTRGPVRRRRERVPLTSLEAGDICEVKILIEDDETNWVTREVMAVDEETDGVTFKAPEGWEEDAEYTVQPEEGETILRVWRPEDAALELAERVLGKAVDPRAIDRMFEIWPEAHVKVEHDSHDFGGRYDGRPLGRGTRVVIFKYNPTAEDLLPSPSVRVAVRCHHEDQYDRKLGTRTAFTRALKALSTEFGDES